ncbi:hypothetical protein MMPV_000830 [Pyropia vietnamensis]
MSARLAVAVRRGLSRWDASPPPPAGAQRRLAAATASGGVAAAAVAPTPPPPSPSRRWYPTTPADLDAVAARTLQAGDDLSSDHPGFADAAYRRRRAAITAAAAAYRWGDPLPVVAYAPSETATWTAVWAQLAALRAAGGGGGEGVLSGDAIPQLGGVDAWLHDRTGWRVRPVGGLLSPRDFLNGLGAKVFHATQYIRHPSVPSYTPEPDVIHELLGHVPLLSIPAFAELNETIGIGSRGASDDAIERLARLYWFTVEFGLLQGDLAGGGSPYRAYGAGLLSSPGELARAVGLPPPFSGEGAGEGEASTSPAAVPEPDRRPLTLEAVAEVVASSYPVTTYQRVYYVAHGLEDAADVVAAYVRQVQAE